MSINIKGIKKEYSGRIVLDIDRFELESGKIFAILGPNGSGKTTLLRIISGIDKATAGTIQYNGYGSVPADSIAFLPQKPYIFDMKVIDNVILGIKKHNNARKLALDALERVGMSDFAEAGARSLSGGEAQRMALARTLVLGKHLVLLDEPATSMDVGSISLVDNYLKHVKEKDGSTIIFTTHNPSQAINSADEVIIVYKGHIAENGPPGEVINSPKTEETRIFLENWRITN